jgi:acetyltransferase
VIVRDDFQGQGLGTELMRRLVRVARAERMERVIGSTMLENSPTVAMMERVGLRVRVNLEDQVIEGEINLYHT